MQKKVRHFLTENPGRNISFIQSAGRTHDRYIVPDEGTTDMKVYHCGASSKDAGKKILLTMDRSFGKQSMLKKGRQTIWHIQHWKK